jgi:HAD superfamily hydrolase (TIGR01509 family)
MSARIEAVLFDLGGVLIEVVVAERMLQWCPALSDTESLWRRWLDSPTVRRYESGKTTRDAFAKSLIEEFALPVEPDAFLAEFARWPRRLYDDAAPLLAELKPRFRLASLSNTNELHWERFTTEWNLPSLFHANFPSHDVGRLKPDADYFEHVLATLGVAPQSALFVDDNAVNVEAAARLGIVARRAIGPQGVRAVLAELKLDA